MEWRVGGGGFFFLCGGGGGGGGGDIEFFLWISRTEGVRGER